MRASSRARAEIHRAHNMHKGPDNVEGTLRRKDPKPDSRLKDHFYPFQSKLLKSKLLNLYAVHLYIPAFMKLCSSRNLASGRNSDGGNGNLEGLSAISNAAPIQNGWPTDPFTTEIMTPRCILIMFVIIRFMVALNNFPIFPVFFARPLPINSPQLMDKPG